MRNTILGLLVTILVLTVVNLLNSFDVIGGGSSQSSASGGGYEYKVLNGPMMDKIGYLAVAADEGIEVPEDGKITFPKEISEKIYKVNLLPRTILEVEKDGGWSFVSVTGDHHYIFRRAK